MKKESLLKGKTPLYKMRFKYGNINIWIKRDDLICFAGGGNKVRLYEYIVPLVKEIGAERIVTYGSQYSNFLRVTAAVCSFLRIGCDLIVLDEGPPNVGGNGTLLDLYDVNVVHCPISNAHDYIDEYQEKLNKEKVRYMWIPGGGHIPEAAFGYVDAAYEIMKQADELGVSFDATFLPCGTGTTQAGLIYGMHNKMDIYGISVARTKEKCVEEITKTLSEMASFGKCDADIGNVNVLYDKRTRYGESTEQIIDISKKVAKSDGIFLDPIYNARAFCGMIEHLSYEESEGYQNVLYVNTGGQPNIYLKG